MQTSVSLNMDIKIHLLVFFILFLVRYSSGECCTGDHCPVVPRGRKACCADGTQRNFMSILLRVFYWKYFICFCYKGGNWCCGKGRCNIFCCNCGGGCRTGHLNDNSLDLGFFSFGNGGRKKRSTEEIVGDMNHFSSFDICLTREAPSTQYCFSHRTPTITIDSLTLF